MSTHSASSIDGGVPRGDSSGFVRYFKNDIISGLLVFLIALPLCLGISMASGYPAIAGVFTAIIGSIVATFVSNSEMTIKGPAAGLIVIAIGCIEDFGGNGLTGGWDAADVAAYKAALAVGVVAAVLQILFGVFRAGILGEFFPTTAVHGMLAAIGVIIIVKQFPVTLGVSAGGEPLEMMRSIPDYISHANPAIAAIGLTSLLIMFVWPAIKKRAGFLKYVPAQVVVLIVAIPMGMGFDLLHEHSYTLQNHKYQLSDQYLVAMPEQMFGMFDDITFPAFGALQEFKAWKWVFMFFIIGTLESVLSAKAVDLLDPWKRKSDMNRDIVAVGLGNCLCGFVGGLPMISEIVRSRANIDNGARTRFANLWHGIFLLLCVALIPMLLHLIPLAALAAMLVYTGYRLAHPTEFINVYRIGKEQLLIFVVTLVTVLATDLLIGVATGIVLKFLIHLVNGVSVRSLFKPYLEVQVVDETTSLIVARESAVFSNWIPLKRQLEQLGLVQQRNLIVDLSGTKFVDHSVMEKLEEVERDFRQQGLNFEVRGLASLKPLAGATHSARKRGILNGKRLTLTVDESNAGWLEEELLARGITDILTSPAGNLLLSDRRRIPQVRLEMVLDRADCDQLVEFLRQDVVPECRVAMVVESVGYVPPSPQTAASAADHAVVESS